MLKNFKLPKRDSSGGSSSRSRISSADISSPTREQPNMVKHMKTIPLREVSSSSSRLPNAHYRNPSKDISMPEKAIKAIYRYEGQGPNELSFEEGDFFYVSKEYTEWYQASNPATKQKGLVPKSFFQVIISNSPLKNHNHTHSNVTTKSVSNESSEESPMGSLYAIVLYDFNAEKSDELTSYAGENLFICAHHNYEWFIAKPINRIGGPGLVPVAFVSIIDIATGYATGNDVKEDIEFARLPTVQEWKNRVNRYKANNIALGEVESSTVGPAAANELGQIMALSIISQTDSTYSILFQASALSNWYIIQRAYQDIYDLQLRLLDSFPHESGKLRDSNGNWTRRVLPSLPSNGPNTKAEFEQYLQKIVQLPKHISQSNYVKNFFQLQFTDDRAISLDELEQISMSLDNEKMQQEFSQLSVQVYRPPSSQLPRTKDKPVKVKFYYKEDIFALLLDNSVTLNALQNKIAPRVDTPTFMLRVKQDDGDGQEIVNDSQVMHVIKEKLRISVHDK